MSMTAIRPVRLFALTALLASLAACASQAPATHTGDAPPASASGIKGNADKGRAIVMGGCSACHSVTKENNSTTMVGPNLFGVVGRKAGTVKSLLGPSESLKKHGVTWSAETLDTFLTNPLAILAPDTAMAGVLPDPQQRADVIAYLYTLK